MDIETVKIHPLEPNLLLLEEEHFITAATETLDGAKITQRDAEIAAEVARRCNAHDALVAELAQEKRRALELQTAYDELVRAIQTRVDV